MKTIDKTQVKAFILTAIVLTVLFSTMIIKNGFNSF